MILFTFWLLCGTFCVCQGGNHPCVDYQLEIDVTARSHQDERLMPSKFYTDSASAVQSKECHWTIKAKFLTSPRPLILEGVPNGDAHEGSEISDSFQYSVYSPEESGCPEEFQQQVSGGTFWVLPIRNRKMRLSVSYFQKKSASPSKKKVPISFRAMMPLPGYCARDMLSFEGNCYAVSLVRLNATVAMDNIGGAAQLATFDSWVEIQKFIQANNARLDQYPYKKPLELSEPVRVGIFYRAADTSVLCLERNFSCSIKQNFRLKQYMNKSADGPCANLRVDEAGRPVVEFGNCSSPMRSLISFAENESSIPTCSNCSYSHRQLVQSLVAPSALSDRPFGHFEDANLSDSKRGGKILALAVTAIAVTALGGVSLFAYIVAKKTASQIRQRPKKGPESTKEDEADHLHAVPSVSSENAKPSVSQASLLQA